MAFFKPFALERFFAKYEFSAKFLLCSSDCESVSIQDILSLEKGSEEKLHNLWLSYTETRGSPSLRNTIAKSYQGINIESVFTHAGAQEAILNTCLALLEKGDRVVVNTPCYQSLKEIPKSLGCDVKYWNVKEQDSPNGKRWFFDPEELENLSEGKAKLIILNAPHNPTGALPTHEEFNAIVEYARKTGAYLFVDEVYRRMEAQESWRLPSVCEVYENGITLDVLSKHAGLAGLRIGWLVSKNLDVLNKIAQVKDYNSICSSGPSEFIAEIAIRNLSVLTSRNKLIINQNLELLDSFFEKNNEFVTWTKPSGSSIGFPHLTDGSDAEKFAINLLQDTSVLLLPGAYYDYDASYFRIGYGRANFPQALEIFDNWINKK